MVVMHVRSASENKAKLAIGLTACNFALLVQQSEWSKKDVQWTAVILIMCLLFVCLSFCCCLLYTVWPDTLSIVFFALSSKARISYTPWCDWDFICPFFLSHSYFCIPFCFVHSQFPLILWVMQTCLNVSLPLEIESRRNNLMISMTFPMVCPVQTRSRSSLKRKRVNRSKWTWGNSRVWWDDLTRTMSYNKTCGQQHRTKEKQMLYPFVYKDIKMLQISQLIQLNYFTII